MNDISVDFLEAKMFPTLASQGKLELRLSLSINQEALRLADELSEAVAEYDNSGGREPFRNLVEKASEYRKARGLT